MSNNSFSRLENSTLVNNNRRKLKIISQNPNEMIVDIDRLEGVQPDGTPISADSLNSRFLEIEQHFNTIVNQKTGTIVNVKNQNGEYDAVDVYFDSDPQIQINNIWQTVYPIGSIYMSVNSADPANLFGGTWVKIQDKFLLGAGTQFGLGVTGGEVSHTLTISEMPSHTHIQNSHTHTQSAHNHGLWSARQYQNNADGLGMNSSDSNINNHAKGNTLYVAGAWNGTTRGDKEKYYYKNNLDNYYVDSVTPTIDACTATNQNTGGGQAHNNMPPYLAVNMWQRTA
ncbi:MAG: hypothetical protein J6C13_04565 [Clostridia bacterium]|nr:hypothetical protein [Clostridia bacterium]